MDFRIRARAGRFSISRLIAKIAAIAGLAAIAGQYAHAQEAEIDLNGLSPFVDLVRHGTWQGTGGKGQLGPNAYVLFPIDPDRGFCLSVSNEDATAHNFTVAVYSTGDPRASFLSAGRVNWLNILPGAQAQGVAASGTAGSNPSSFASLASIFIPASGAAKLAIEISNITSADSGTASAYVVQSTRSQCNSLITGMTARFSWFSAPVSGATVFTIMPPNTGAYVITQLLGLQVSCTGNSAVGQMTLGTGTTSSTITGAWSSLQIPVGNTLVLPATTQPYAQYWTNSYLLGSLPAGNTCTNVQGFVQFQ